MLAHEIEALKNYGQNYGGNEFPFPPSCRKYPDFRPAITRDRFKGHSAFLSDWRDVPLLYHLSPHTGQIKWQIRRRDGGTVYLSAFLFQKAKLFLN